MMITKGEINLLLEIYNNKGRTTAKEQTIYTCMNKFYNAITKLKKQKMIESFTIEIDNADKRIFIYELTLRGITFVKILLGEDY